MWRRVEVTVDSVEERLRELFVGGYRRLVSQVYFFCGDLGEAEDAVQEAFVRAVARQRQFARVENPEAWLRVVALNVVRRRAKRAGRFRGLFAGVSEPGVQPALSPDHVALVDGFRQLPAAQREALVLHHLADLPVREISAQLGVPEGTVKARLARGRERLAGLMDELADEPVKEADHA
ncbi:RNA polymerase sigma factor [Kribbella sandramycini]|uniref:RNA polymerase sigma factor n=1 Tax=Kribbella sandramycini TaxID=60450 RepID=A0A7Y4P4L7_9ACTN|nr:RNA polymerase sigma factor [Kribbella sandramycini]